MEDVLDLARRVMDRALGEDGAVEAYVEHRIVTTVQAATGGTIRHVGRADTRGVGVRVIVGNRVGYASTADVSEEGLGVVMARARANAHVSDADVAGAALPSPAPAAALEGLGSPGIAAMSPTDKMQRVATLARRVTELDARVRRLDTAQWQDQQRRVAVASTLGVEAAYETAFAELWTDALGTDEYGEATDYGYWWGRDPADVDVETLAREAVTRTVRLLGPPSTVERAHDVVLDGAVTALLLQAIGRALTGGALGSGRSPFAGRQGERIAADLVRLVDDGRCGTAPAGAPFDAEGVPRRRTTLIDGGVLSGTLHSCATAASVGNATSTGNARRTNHKSTPRAAPSTLRLDGSSTSSPLESDGQAVYLRQVSGSVSGVSSVTGRVSLGGVGYLLRGGEPAGRISTLPVATTLQSFLDQIVAIGDDARVVPERPVLAPTVLWRPNTSS